MQSEEGEVGESPGQDGQVHPTTDHHPSHEQLHRRPQPHLILHIALPNIPPRKLKSLHHPTHPQRQRRYQQQPRYNFWVVFRHRQDVTHR